MFSLIGGLLSSIIGSITNHFENKQKLQDAIVENKLRLAASEQTHNEDWEMKQLENAGWKDDILFYAWIALFVWSAFDPSGSAEVFRNWSYLPDWFVQLSAVIIGSVLGIRKMGDYCPALIRGVKTAWTTATATTNAISEAKQIMDSATSVEEDKPKEEDSKKTLKDFVLE